MKKMLKVLREWLKEIEGAYSEETIFDEMLLLVRMPCGCWSICGPEDREDRIYLLGDYIAWEHSGLDHSHEDEKAAEADDEDPPPSVH